MPVCFIDNKEEHKKSERKQRTKMKAGFFCCKITFRPSAFWCRANGKSADLLLATKTNENLRLLHTTTSPTTTMILRVTIKKWTTYAIFIINEKMSRLMNSEDQ